MPLTLNVNSLSAHIDEIRNLLAENPLDIIAINESKLNKLNQGNEVYVPAYEIVRRDSLGDGGGWISYLYSYEHKLIHSY